MLARLNFSPNPPPQPSAMQHASNSQSQPLTSRRVAVIGAGAGGLVSARELGREGHSVVVFERSSQIGGTWVYSPEIESDPLGVDPNRTRIHSSLYKSLRTNLPRELMGVRDYPFVPREGEGRDPRRFPSHLEVLKYLEDFANEFGICELVRFGTEVVSAGLVEVGKWRVRFRCEGGDVDDEMFDAVVVCVGNYSQPRVAEIPGIDEWPGEQIHSHNYRDPEPFRGKVVILIGFSSSGTDISQELLVVAKEIHIACRSAKTGFLLAESVISKVSFHPMIKSVRKDGTVVFEDGCVVSADVILHCTGYKYHFPFLKTNGIVTVDDNRVGPLYKHVFPPALAPGLSFVGLPFKVVPLPMFELQSNWVAGVLSKRIALPLKEEMLADVKAFYEDLEANGKPKHRTHEMSDCMVEYFNWLAATCGCPAYEEWRKGMYDYTHVNKRANLGSYRDDWHDDKLIHQAYEEFRKYTTNGRSEDPAHLNV
ncbi:flavin-containing monooxygenase FMO GS-OX-like 3 [Cucurbita pepo subsp. pepo]|uniref:flavin-containing monooxygenase FMO GS-OX-like 3 n=1 Tax=Cucurbita pepo subsp. pepo TaxID=3664 RepID=UPI000C9DA388|nr:flavin-containing monooxygenase FMO GS-OX-like 3 [Cucurbita pepo subsp. pepo]